MRTKIAIGIQARSTSTRRPGKVLELIGNRPLICHVVGAARSAASYVNRYKSMGPFEAKVFLLTPSGDPVGRVVGDYYSDVSVIEGDENNVLSRYAQMQKEFDADFVVRVTGDCPLIPPFLISKAILESFSKQFHYLSNCYEGRISPDGWDCEVIQKRLFEWLLECAQTKSDMEHVTTLIKKSPPGWAHMGLIHGFLDLSGVKVSVDTEEDLARVREQIENMQKVESEFRSRYQGDVIRF